MSITATILGDGKAMDPAYQLLALSVQREVNRIPHAELTLRDGDAAVRKFQISDSSFFEPGKEIEIKLRYEGDEDETVFKGIVVRHAVESGNEGSRLVVGLKDKALKLTGVRRSAIFRDETDSDIIGKIAGDAGLEKGTMTRTRINHKQLVQYYATDWDFMLSRADANGLCVSINDGAVSVAGLAVSGPVVHTFQWGISEIYEIDFEADAGHQFGAVESFGWDPQSFKLTSGATAKSVAASQGNLDGGKVGKAIGFDSYTLLHPVPAAPVELQAWADGTMARSRAAMLRGRMAVPGLAAVKLLDVMEISGCGERFKGRTVVTGLSHRVNLDGWTTDLQFGFSPEPYATKPQIVDSPAGGLLPWLTGLQIGVVADYADDPDKAYRVKISLPAVAKGDATLWARLCSPDAGKERGYVFRPEVGDEVVIGFLNGDPRHAVILGSLFGSKNTLPGDFKPSSENKNKGLVTKKGTTIGFVDDDKASVYIQTAQNNKILLDDQAQAIKITDQHGNSVTMDKSGIVLKSAKDFKIDASSGNVEISGTKVDVK